MKNDTKLFNICLALHGLSVLFLSESHTKVNGYSRSQERQRSRPSSGSDQEPDSDASENESSSSVSSRPRTRRTAMAAVSKMKLMDILEEDDASDEEGRGRSVRHVTRASKRSTVIQSSGDSEEDDTSQDGKHTN